MSSYKKFGTRWWKKREQAHDYLEKIYEMNNLSYMTIEVTGLILLERIQRLARKKMLKYC